MDQSKMPLVEALKKFKSLDSISFHVPGHKNGLLDQTGFMDSVGSYDVTELTSLDDLHAPTGVIKEAQDLLSIHYQSEKSYFLINGTTVGNLAMILATCDPGDTVLVMSNSHKSIINACSLGHISPVFIEPLIHQESQTAQGITLETLKQAIQRYPKVKAIVLTYPTYYGYVFDLESLIEEAHLNDLIVLIDEAHGAHLTVGSPFPVSSLSLGADMVVQSAHKTLPAMTMGSYLHIGTSRVNRGKVERLLGMLQSSSPSYPIMASLDAARSYLATMTELDIEFFMRFREQFVNGLSQCHGVTVIEADDPLKLLLRIKNYTGYELKDKLESQGIFVELADPLQVLLILPLLIEDIANSSTRTIQAIRKIDAKEPSTDDFTLPLVRINESIKELAIPLHVVDKATSEWISIVEATGEVAAASIIPYPPGIPYIIAGERITEEKVLQLSKWISKNYHFHGEQRISEGKIKVVSDGGKQ